MFQEYTSLRSYDATQNTLRHVELALYHTDVIVSKEVVC